MAHAMTAQHTRTARLAELADATGHLAHTIGQQEIRNQDIQAMKHALGSHYWQATKTFHYLTLEQAAQEQMATMFTAHIII
jgi:hypothetical protein